MNQIHWFPKKVLAIESSCDETAIAVVDGPNILSNAIASQIDLHKQWGGIVPEVAARAHVESTIPLLETALELANTCLGDIGGIAVTNRPGLIGSLSVGVAFAKALAYSLKIPWIGIHHLEGHLWSVLALDPHFGGPCISLIASGGHTELIKLSGVGQYQLLGTTRDDAAGEAFDKCARLLGLGSPGGVVIQNMANDYSGKPYPLPIAKVGDYEFSYSGLKTAVSLLVSQHGNSLNTNRAAFSIQQAIVEPLVTKSISAAVSGNFDTLCVVGGVSANVYLRDRLQAEAERHNIRLLVPPLDLCTDNAAMIGLIGSIRLELGQFSANETDVSSSPELPKLSGI